MEQDLLESSIEEETDLNVSFALQELRQKVESFKLSMEKEDDDDPEEIEEEILVPNNMMMMPPPAPPQKVIEWDTERNAKEFQMIKNQISTLLQRIENFK